jgi:hypothetical protein
MEFPSVQLTAPLLLESMTWQAMSGIGQIAFGVAQVIAVLCGAVAGSTAPTTCNRGTATTATRPPTTATTGFGVSGLNFKDTCPLLLGTCPFIGRSPIEIFFGAGTFRLIKVRNMRRKRENLPVKQVADLFFSQISDLRYFKPVKQVSDLFFPQISDLRYFKPVKQVSDLFFPQISDLRYISRRAS